MSFRIFDTLDGACSSPRHHAQFRLCLPMTSLDLQHVPQMHRPQRLMSDPSSSNVNLAEHYAQAVDAASQNALVDPQDNVKYEASDRPLMTHSSSGLSENSDQGLLNGQSESA